MRVRRDKEEMDRITSINGYSLPQGQYSHHAVVWLLDLGRSVRPILEGQELQRCLCHVIHPDDTWDFDSIDFVSVGYMATHLHHQLGS